MLPRLLKRRTLFIAVWVKLEARFSVIASEAKQSRVKSVMSLIDCRSSKGRLAMMDELPS